MSWKTSKARRRIVGVAAGVASVVAIAVGGSVGATAALANDTAVVDLQNTTATQSDTSRMTFTDRSGAQFVVDVTTTWQRASDSQATLNSLILRPVSFPGGACLGLVDVTFSGSQTYFSQGNRTLCPDGLLTYNVGATATTYGGNVLGQLTIRTPNTVDGGGVMTVVVEYHT